MTHRMVSWPIVRARTALIVVDMQKVFCEPDGELYVPATAGIIAPLKQLIGLFRESGMLVVFLRHVLRGDGSDSGRMADIYPGIDRTLARDNPAIEIIDDLPVSRGDVVVDKLFYSGFHQTDLDTVLRAHDVDTVVIGGTVTNVCCETTVRDAVHREYKVIVVADACAAMPYPDMGFGPVSAAEVQRMALTGIAYEFGEVTITERLVDRIERAS